MKKREESREEQDKLNSSSSSRAAGEESWSWFAWLAAQPELLGVSLGWLGSGRIPFRQFLSFIDSISFFPQPTCAPFLFLRSCLIELVGFSSWLGSLFLAEPLAVPPPITRNHSQAKRSHQSIKLQPSIQHFKK